MKIDKLLHFLVGYSIAATLIPFGFPIAILAVTMAAIGKEAYDYQGFGTPEVADAIVTILGGFAFLIIRYGLT